MVKNTTPQASYSNSSEVVAENQIKDLLGIKSKSSDELIMDLLGIKKPPSIKDDSEHIKKLLGINSDRKAVIPPSTQLLSQTSLVSMLIKNVCMYVVSLISIPAIFCLLGFV